MLIPVQTFAPDAAPEAPGVLRECAGWVPTERGMRACATTMAQTDALASAAAGAASLVDLTGATSVYAGTASNIYKLSGTTWSSVGSGYTLSAGDNWYYTTFGNDALAANLSTLVQRNSAGSFATVTGSPKADILEAVPNLFVMGFNIIDGSWGTYPDGWWCCAQSDVTSWSPSIATQAARGRFLETPGGVTAAKVLGSQVVVYKDRSLYVGTYQGPPTIWSWSLLPGAAGAVGKFAVGKVTINGVPALLSVGRDNLWLFDGSRPTPIGDGEVRRWFYGSLNSSHTSKTSVIDDPDRGLAYILFANQSSQGTLNDCLVWAYKLGRWGRGRDFAATHGVQYAKAAETFGTLGTGQTFGQLGTGLTFGTLGNKGGQQAPAVMSANKIATIDGIAGASSFVTSAVGSDETISLVSRVRPRFSKIPTTAALKLRHRDALASSPSETTVTTLLNNRFDVLSEDRWFEIYVETQGDAEMSALDVMVDTVSDE